MKRLILLVLLLAATLHAQGGAAETKDPRMRRMPDGRTQAEHILESEYEKSKEDVDELAKLVEELKLELEKNDHNVLSLKAVKVAEEIEKIAKQLKNRLKRY